MCQGVLDPKYGLQALEQSFKVARQADVKMEENREPGPGLWAWAFALMTRFQRKDMTHG